MATTTDLAEATTGLPGVAPLQAARSNPVRTRADWDAMRAAAVADPGAFHGAIAKATLHWLVPVEHGTAWLSFDEEKGLWSGWNSATAEPVTADLGAGYEPWNRAFNADDPPHWK